MTARYWTERSDTEWEELRDGTRILDLAPPDPESMSAYSVEVERRWGWDSIPTIDNQYRRDGQSACVCVFPRCQFRRHDAVEMWRHVHGPTHQVGGEG